MREPFSTSYGCLIAKRFKGNKKGHIAKNYNSVKADPDSLSITLSIQLFLTY
jgi:hypothetical protein